MNVMLQGAKSQSYTLVCTGPGGSITKTVALALEGACSATPAARTRHVATSRAIAAARRAVANGTAGARRSGGK
jgi:hypothetical protein